LKVVALVQCTAGDLGDSRNENDYVIGVCKRSPLFDSIALACPDEAVSDELERLADHWGINCYRGDQFNVASRLLGAAIQENADIVVRVLLRQFYLDTPQVERMVAALINRNASYVTLPNNYNYALAADVCTCEALSTAVSEIEGISDPLEQASFRFSPWVYMERLPQKYPAAMVDGGSAYSFEKAMAIRERCRQIQSENQVHFSWNFPASSYRFVGNYLNGDEAVLDIACGKGQGSRCLKDFSSSVVGVDMDERNISHAISTVGDTDGLQFKIGDAERFVEENTYDVVVSLHTLEHLSNPDAFLECVCLNLLGQGRLFLEVPLLLAHPLNMPLHPWHEKEYLLPELVAKVRANGFVIDEIWVKQRHVFLKMPITNDSELKNVPGKSTAGLILAHKNI